MKREPNVSDIIQQSISGPLLPSHVFSPDLPGPFTPCFEMPLFPIPCIGPIRQCRHDGSAGRRDDQLFQPILGACVFIVLRDLFSSVWEHWMLVYGLLFMFVIIFLPKEFWDFSNGERATRVFCFQEMRSGEWKSSKQKTSPRNLGGWWRSIK